MGLTAVVPRQSSFTTCDSYVDVLAIIDDGIHIAIIERARIVDDDLLLSSEIK